MARQRYGRELWDRLCEAVATDDGLPTSKFGGFWTAKKLFHLCHYIEQVARGMGKNTQFDQGLTYVDLFCGCGVCEPKIDPAGRRKRYPGSVLFAASTPNQFRRLLLCDSDSDALRCASERVRRLGYQGEVREFCGDVNQLADSIAAAIPPRSLCVTFIDPYSLGVDFGTIAKLASQRPMDLMVLITDGYDIVRNTETYYYPRENHTLDRFLGPDCDWRRAWDSMTNRDAASIRALFAELYQEQLRKIGYRYSQHWPVDGPHGPVFRLLFASKNELGLKYCDIALREDFDGTLGLFGR
jgi:three-Cys-motif partner protein